MAQPPQEYPLYSHGEILDFRKAVGSMTELRPGPKALFNAVAAAIRTDKGNAVLTDDQLVVDYGCQDRTTIYRNRLKLIEAGVLGYVPGRFKQASVYWIILSPAKRDDLLARRTDKKIENRAQARASSDARMSALRSVAKPKLQHSEEDEMQHSAMRLREGIATQCEPKICNTATLQGCSTSLPTNTPYKRLTVEKVSSYVHAREVVPMLRHVDEERARQASPTMEFEVEVPAWLTPEERLRGAVEINGYIARKANEAGLSSDQVDMALGDRLSRMALGISIFPGDNIGNFRKVDAFIASLLREETMHAAE